MLRFLEITIHIICTFSFLESLSHITTVPPPPPTNVRIVETTEDSVTVEWDPPVGGANFTYDIYSSIANRDRVLAFAGVSGTRATVPSKLTLATAAK